MSGRPPPASRPGLAGVVGLSVRLTDDENGRLNPEGINCLRTFRGIGSVVWGARTLRGADVLADEYKYVPVRRLALFLEESLYRGTQWVVFEPNDEPLWAQIRASSARSCRTCSGAGPSRAQARATRSSCDATPRPPRSTTSTAGIVNIQVGFAPLKPAEFVIIAIQQKTASAGADALPAH